MRINHVGRIGIGQNSVLPFGFGGSPLTVAGNNTDFRGNIHIVTTDSFAQDRGGKLSFGYRYNSAGSDTYSPFIVGRKENAIDGDTAGYLGFGTNNNEKMRITSNGNVGIGTTTPTAQIQMNGSFCMFNGNCSNISIGGNLEGAVITVGPNDAFFGNNKVIINGDALPGPILSVSNFQDTNITSTKTALISFWGSSNTTIPINTVALEVSHLGKLKNFANHIGAIIVVDPFNQSDPAGKTFGAWITGKGGNDNFGAWIRAEEGNNSTSAQNTTGIKVEALNADTNIAISATASGGTSNTAIHAQVPFGSFAGIFEGNVKLGNRINDVETDKISIVGCLDLGSAHFLCYNGGQNFNCLDACDGIGFSDCNGNARKVWDDSQIPCTTDSSEALKCECS